MREFGNVLRVLRKSACLTQRELENKNLGLSYSFIAQLEAGLRGKTRTPLNRKQVWYFVEKLKLVPRDCDKLLEAAGMSINRSVVEEQRLRSHTLFDEVWEFSYSMSHTEPCWFPTIKADIGKGVCHNYFLPHQSKSSFCILHRKLQTEKINKKELTRLLECNLLPPELFQGDFTLFKAGESDTWGSGSIKRTGDCASNLYYTLNSSEVYRRYEILQEIRNCLNVNLAITFPKIQRIWPI